MSFSETDTGQQDINREVLQEALCTGCAACVNLCPYFKTYKDRTAIIHACDKKTGRCYDYCPRTPTDMDVLARAIFDAKDLTPELGSFKGLYITRAADKKIRSVAQHGGTVTALMSLALREKIIDAAIVSAESDQRLAEGTVVSNPEALLAQAKSKFVASPNLATFNQVSKKEIKNYGIVATPCQALAIAKMKYHAPDSDRQRVEQIRLVIGLFCGWALDWRKLTQMLSDKLGQIAIQGLDIPPSKHACMEVYTDSGTVEIPIEEVNACVRENCRYCYDMTCEFADISVGSARSPEGWEVDRHWNQVIVRSDTGRQLLELARDKKVLEFKQVPQGNLEKLKNASANKKRTCVKNLAQKTGNDKDLIYLDATEPMLKGILPC